MKKIISFLALSYCLMFTLAVSENQAAETCKAIDAVTKATWKFKSAEVCQTELHFTFWANHDDGLVWMNYGTSSSKMDQKYSLYPSYRKGTDKIIKITGLLPGTKYFWQWNGNRPSKNKSYNNILSGSFTTLTTNNPPTTILQNIPNQREISKRLNSDKNRYQRKYSTYLITGRQLISPNPDELQILILKP